MNKLTRFLITGVCGTIGKALLKHLSKMDNIEVIGIDNNESELFFIGEEYRNRDNIRVQLGDLRDRDKLIRKMDGIDIVFHTAALKHVILCEQSPRDAVQTNIIGTQNIIDAAIACNVQRVLFTSSDKAVNPTNVMGTSKLMGERLLTAANAHRRGSGPIFSSTRFGNVLGSRGSVIPLFKKQIAAGGPITLTDEKMTRFIMTLDEAVSLVIDSAFLAKGGEVFITKMLTVRILDLAEIMIEVMAPKYGLAPSDIKINTIGSKAGEKLYEELVNDEETRRTLELPKYFVVTPAFKSLYENIEYTYPEMKKEIGISHSYNSALDTCLSKSALKEYLLKNNLLSETLI